MKKVIVYERLNPTTYDGEIIKVTTFFSSFDKTEIDKLEEKLENIIGTALVSEFILEDEDMRGDKNGE